MINISNAIALTRIICMCRIVTVNYYPHLFYGCFGVDYTQTTASVQAYQSVINSNSWFIDKITTIFAFSGWSSVVAFTILSGFSLWLSNREFNLSQFISKRISKIYVPYMITLVIAILLGVLLFNKNMDFISVQALLLCIPRLTTNAYDINPPMWYMTAIMSFYVFSIFVFLYFKKIKTWIWTVATLGLLIVALFVTEVGRPFYPMFPFIVFGMIGILICEYALKLQKIKLTTIAVSLIPVMAVLFILLNTNQTSTNWTINLIPGFRLSGFIMLGIIEFFLYMAIGYLLPDRMNETLKFLGRGTFAIFLFHYLLHPFLTGFMTEVIGEHIFISILVTYSAMLIIFSWYQYGIDKLVVNKIRNLKIWRKYERVEGNY